jgi:hypothetical protein
MNEADEHFEAFAVTELPHHSKADDDMPLERNTILPAELGTPLRSRGTMAEAAAEPAAA